MKSVLNVGGGSRDIALPGHYAGWDQVFLDIDESVAPDLWCDARDLFVLPAGVYHAVHCSHNLEHYWRHDMPRVLAGFAHVLRVDGFAEILVPDLKSVFAEVQRRDMDLEDVLYVSPSGPITVNDVIYGFGTALAETGNDFYAHKNAFTPKSLAAALNRAGFPFVFISPGFHEIRALAFKAAPSDEYRTLLAPALVG